MTPVGHSLCGASLAVFCTPRLKSLRARTACVASFVLLASLPDLPIPGWGHDSYLVSHSLLVNSAMVAAAAIGLSLWRQGRTWIGGVPVILGGAVAWLSHLLLDSLYNHGQGIVISWPWGSYRFALPVPWFSTLQGKPPPLNAHTFRVCLIEFLAFLPILLICLYGRRFLCHSPCRGKLRRGQGDGQRNQQA